MAQFEFPTYSHHNRSLPPDSSHCCCFPHFSCEAERDWLAQFSPLFFPRPRIRYDLLPLLSSTEWKRNSRRSEQWIQSSKDFFSCVFFHSARNVRASGGVWLQWIDLNNFPRVIQKSENIFKVVTREGNILLRGQRDLRVKLALEENIALFPPLSQSFSVCDAISAEPCHVKNKSAYFLFVWRSLSFAGDICRPQRDFAASRFEGQNYTWKSELWMRNEWGCYFYWEQSIHVCCLLSVVSCCI